MIKVSILGASGYTGAELVRIISNHPKFAIKGLSADKKSGLEYCEVFPQFTHLSLPKLTPIEEIDLVSMDLIFSALPHATSQSVISKIPHNVKVIDLSADFRIRDPEIYTQWYGVKHQALKLQREAVYGLTEFYRSEISLARLVACTGCNAAAAMYPLLPLIKNKLISTNNIVINVAAGISGAGRALKESSLHSEISEGISAYNVANHRHMAEFRQEFSLAAGEPVEVSFTPHLAPQNRGILATINVEGDSSEIHKALSVRYKEEPFIHVLPKGAVPSTRHVRGSNYCHVGVVKDSVEGKTILFSVIDNLTKGSSGQAVQNANLMFNFPETLALNLNPIFP